MSHSKDIKNKEQHSIVLSRWLHSHSTWILRTRTFRVSQLGQQGIGRLQLHFPRTGGSCTRVTRDSHEFSHALGYVQSNTTTHNSPNNRCFFPFKWIFIDDFHGFFHSNLKFQFFFLKCPFPSGKRPPRFDLRHLGHRDGVLRLQRSVASRGFAAPCRIHRSSV